MNMPFCCSYPTVLWDILRNVSLRREYSLFAMELR